MTPPGIDPGALQLVAQCLNHYATPGQVQRVLMVITVIDDILGLSGNMLEKFT
jgi:hypothetical protein